MTKLGHDWGEWYTENEPTCTEKGLEKRVCKNDSNHVETNDIDALGHDWGEWYTETEPTCTEKGLEKRVCKNDSNHVETNDIDALGHESDGNWTVTVTPTCINKGEEQSKCVRYDGTTCDKIFTRELGLDQNNHVGNTYVKDKKDATCTEDGYTGDTYCSDCNAKLSSGHVIAKKDHEMGEWTVSKNATLLETGIEVRKCKNCSYAEERSIPKLEGTVSENKESGIAVIYTPEAYDEDITVEINETFDGAQFFTQQYANIKTWNIKTYINGQEVQPTEPVKVRIPLPEGYNENTVAVYHIDSNTGRRERIQPVIVEDGCICFLATSFSVYILVDESSEITVSDPSANCSCKCHKTGFMGFIWKIQRFFYKLFKINPTCSCGVAHY